MLMRDDELMAAEPLGDPIKSKVGSGSVRIYSYVELLKDIEKMETNS